MSFSGSILKDQPPWPSDSHWNLAIQTAANYANCEGLVLQSSLGLSVCTWPVDGSRGHGVPKMLTQTNWIWSRANGPHFPSAQQIPHGNYLRSSTISNKHVIEPEGKKKKVYQYQKHGDERPIPQEGQLDRVKCWKTSVIILKQNIIPWLLFFFPNPQTPKTVQANKNNF